MVAGIFAENYITKIYEKRVVNEYYALIKYNYIEFFHGGSINENYTRSLKIYEYR